jgi:hypothetical protein
VVIASNVASTTLLTSALDMPHWSATADTNSLLFTVQPPCQWWR